MKLILSTLVTLNLTGPNDDSDGVLTRLDDLSVVMVPAKQLYIHQLGLEQDSIWLQQGAPLFHAGCLGAAPHHLSSS